MRRLSIISAFTVLLFSGCNARSLAFWIHDTPPPPPGGQELTDTLVWAMGVSFIGVAASVAALVWLPTKKIALAALAGFLAMFILAVGTKVIQPYLGYVVLGGMLLLAGGAAIVIRKYVIANRLMGSYGNAAVATPVDPVAIAKLKADHAATQAAAGVRGIIDHALKTISPKA